MLTLDKDGEPVTDPAFAAELRINRRLEGRDERTGHRITITHRKGAEKLGVTGPSMICETCGRDGLVGRHPCRFEIACVCWYGIACSGKGTVAGSHADRKAAGL